MKNRHIFSLCCYEQLEGKDDRKRDDLDAHTYIATLYHENEVPPELERNLQLCLTETFFSPDYVCI